MAEWIEIRCAAHPKRLLASVRPSSKATAFCRDCNAFVEQDGSKVDNRRRRKVSA